MNKIEEEELVSIKLENFAEEAEAWRRRTEFWAVDHDVCDDAMMRRMLGECNV